MIWLVLALLALLVIAIYGGYAMARAAMLLAEDRSAEKVAERLALLESLEKKIAIDTEVVAMARRERDELVAVLDALRKAKEAREHELEASEGVQG